MLSCNLHLGATKNGGQLLLLMAYSALIVDFLISVLYGMPETNSTSSRPRIIVFIAYFIGPLKLSVYIYLLLAILSNSAKKINIICLVILLLGSGLAVGSRSTMFTLLSLFVLTFPMAGSHFRFRFGKVFWCTVICSTDWVFRKLIADW